MIVVFISSPYTIGDTAVNVRRQIDTAKELMDLGYCPILPLLSHFEHLVHPRPYDDWLKIDKEKILRSDCVLRLFGESGGADIEEVYAKDHGIPVYYSIMELPKL